ncbi:hypothetical protein B0A48_06265 [Cryoendolithus antarcticus]|uniref:EthD domain-containing protein n=1 Tax=Cryoendolithus antarcticus TaxID=1507870 RepID=A0A1V8TAI8_9PEZI|nr:hypothetical protein B0A48_06265 [Cryoendolithus antarcticus]
MASVTFHLISTSSKDDFLTSVQQLPQPDRPHYLGNCEHWIHAPSLSVPALTGTGSKMQRWDFLLIRRTKPEFDLEVPSALAKSVDVHWATATTIPDEQLDALESENKRRAALIVEPLPEGWSPSDHSGLDASDPPSDLEASLALSSVPLGASRSSTPLALKDFIKTFGTSHSGPVAMFNLLAYHPGQRPRYFEYIAAFGASIGSRYGGDAQFIGFGGCDWSSRESEGTQVADPKANGSSVWEDCALVWYPSIWHFGKMLDDPEYAEVDRKFKQGALRDNPLICCTEIQVKYSA